MENPPKRKYKKHKQGYTVSVAYMLRKDKNFLEKLLSREDYKDGKAYLPIYVRVVFLQQTAMIRSRLREKLSEEEFDSYITRPDVAKLIEFETAAIRHSIEEFGPDKREGFTMSQWTSFYNSWNEPIKEVVETEIGSRIMADIKAHPAVNTRIGLDIDILLGAALGNFETIRLFADLGLTIAQVYVKRYQTLFQLAEIKGIDKKVGHFTMWDWKLGLYQKYIRELHTKSSANIYLKSIHKVLDGYQPFE